MVYFTNICLILMVIFFKICNFFNGHIFFTVKDERGEKKKERKGVAERKNEREMKKVKRRKEKKNSCLSMKRE